MTVYYNCVSSESEAEEFEKFMSLAIDKTSTNVLLEHFQPIRKILFLYAETKGLNLEDLLRKKCYQRKLIEK